MTKADTDHLGGLLQHRRDHARWHAPSIAKPRPLRSPLRPKHHFFGACGRGGLHVEHNTDNPAHNPVPIGGFYDHRTPVTACRRRVAPLWSQFPQTTRTNAATGHELAATARDNRARTSWQPPLAPTTPTRPDGTRPASQNRAHYVVHFAPNATLSAHVTEADCTLSTTPTIHRTTPPCNGGFCDHRTPVTACRRRVAPLWSQFPPPRQQDQRQILGVVATHAMP